jgi:hypothetical protein
MLRWRGITECVKLSLDDLGLLRAVGIVWILATLSALVFRCVLNPLEVCLHPKIHEPHCIALLPVGLSIDSDESVFACHKTSTSFSYRTDRSRPRLIPRLRVSAACFWYGQQCHLPTSQVTIVRRAQKAPRPQTGNPRHRHSHDSDEPGDRAPLLIPSAKGAREKLTHSHDPLPTRVPPSR